MIYTCTINPSIDYIIHIDSFQYGNLNRGERAAYYPGGKGINVSRILKRLAIDNTALGYIGGFTGDYIKEALHQEGIKTDFITIDGVTRINMKMKSSKETEINGPGPDISQQELDQLFHQVEQLTAGDTLVVAGSLPHSLPDDLYVNLASVCAKKQVDMVADTSSGSLKALLGTPLFLVKPNHHELGELFNTTITSTQDAIYYGKKILNNGVEHVLISMGGEGAIYLNNKQCLIAKAPKGDVINTVGAGDSTVAGFLAGLQHYANDEQAFRYAVASGSATAFSADLALKADVDALVDHVQITAR
ncbi:1-phosphofructokinase [Amphibacillus jilinensis]|uniref:1-phosphofructokinase n=1 Tax=Amphibacillus jilinensis TaxID=1216008 RepID=UPI00031F74EA|nr:1-phosphofructokinase [Amphibacillus jilinensis]